MARKRRYGRRGIRFGKWVNLAFKVIGGTVAASPIIRRAQENLPSGNITNFLEQTRLDFTAADGKDFTRGVQTYGAILGGIVIAKVGSFIGRRF